MCFCCPQTSLIEIQFPVIMIIYKDNSLFVLKNKIKQMNKKS